MKRSILTFSLLLFSLLSFSQEQALAGVMKNVEFNILYRGYENRMEMITCEQCDSVYVFSKDAVINMLEEGQFIVKPNRGSRDLTLSVKCIVGNDTTDLWRERFHIKSLPQPNVYLGGIHVQKDFNHVKEVSLFGQTHFSIRYDERVPLTGIKFRAIGWSIKVGKSRFTAEGAKLTDEFRNAFVKARKGTKIYFDYVTIIAPDGIARKVKLDQTYIKKEKRNAEYDFDAEQRRWTTPERCG
jgi:hypothetical protein